MEVALPDQPQDGGAGGVVRREEWRRRGSGGLQHTQIEATHWSAPAHSYGKVIEGVSCVGADGRSLRACRQVEVLSARGPGLLQVLTASHTTSHSHSSSSTGFQRHFDDLQLKVNPLDVSSQKERLSIGRSGMLSGRRPPSKVRPMLTDGNSTVSRLCHWFDADTPVPELQSPSIVANGSQKITTSNGHSKDDVADVQNSSDKSSSCSETTDTNDKTFKSSKTSLDSLYDSCPEKESVFKDETDQLEEWRRASKVRRSLQYPGKISRSSSSKPLDLPDNWGSVSRIKKELENCQKQTWFTKNIRTTFTGFNEESMITSQRPENISEEPENITQDDDTLSDNFIIKPSILKKKSFIDMETLNEVRGKLKSMSDHKPHELDDGIDAEDVEKLQESIEDDQSKAPVNVKSYVFGMEAKCNPTLQNKSNYTCGTNSLESRVSKLINGISNRSDDWHARRKSYGFEKVQSAQKMTNYLSSNLEKTNMESSTDSGICRSTEVMNTSNNYSMLNSKNEDAIRTRGTVISLGNMEKKESFESWLMNNRKPVNIAQSPVKRLEPSESKRSYLEDDAKFMKTSQISISIPLKADDENGFIRQKESEDQKNLYKPNLMTSSVTSFTKQPEDYTFKRHTIAVDGFKSSTSINDYANDIFEKKNKKVEFCKTEVHFTADSGKVNIVETDGKPPSTNNFRRRRKSSGVVPIKDVDKSVLPVTHFGDTFLEKTPPDVSNNEDGLKVNYAIITEIKTKEIEQKSETNITSNIQADDVSENEQPRGILKNKPIKPIPYHLGEDKNVLSEINPTQYNLEKNVWGIKLRPTQSKSDSIWSSSLNLQSDMFKESAVNGDTNDLNDASYGKIQKVTTEHSITKSNTTNQIEVKGYSTKVNFGNGDPIIETTYNHKDKSSERAAFNHIGNFESNKQSIVISKYLKSPAQKDYKHNSDDELRAVSKIKNAMNGSHKESVDDVDKRSVNKNQSPTFADSISTPRSLMPTRGSARKLKDHELSYFGVKASSDYQTNSLKRESKLQTNKVEIVKKKEYDDKPSYGNIKSNHFNTVDKYTPKTMDAKTNPIYENVQLTKKLSNSVTTKSIHSGESIIDELTKAADEILQALHDYSDDEPTKLNYNSDSMLNRYDLNSQPLATISETVSRKDQMKSEHKAVQTIIGGTKRFNTISTTRTAKTRTSSNSSLDSITKEAKIPTTSRKKPAINEQSLERPEKPQRRKTSSGEVVKARRLQRASSRDALLQFHGSSSEDLSGHLDVTRKKTSRRIKHNGELSKKDDTRLSSDKSMERRKESSRSSKYTVVPEIRHKTAVSTIMSLTERHSNSDKGSDKVKSTNHERNKHRERIREGTISSLARDKNTIKEKSSTSDILHERENGYHKERTHSRESSHRRDKSRDKLKMHHSDNLKKISEDMGSDVERRKKSHLVKKSSASSTTVPGVRSLPRDGHNGRSYDRQCAGGKMANTRTEYDRSLRLI